MPHRLITAAIIVFWLGMTGWLIQREVVPTMLAESAPSFRMDLADELGSPVIAWAVMRDGKRIGSARSRIRVRDDRSRDFHVLYQFSEFSFGPIEVSKIELTYHVSEEGKLLALATKFEASSDAAKFMFGNRLFTIELKGKIIDEEMEPILVLNEKEKISDLGKIKYVQKGHFVNPMHLLNRVRDLHEGQTWVIALPDLKSGAHNQLVGDLVKQAGGPSTLIATVRTGSLVWQGKEVDCFKIEYHEPGKEVAIHTWVRKADGLMLQQGMTQFGFDMVVQRMP